MHEYLFYYGLVPLILRLALPTKRYWIANVVYLGLSIFVLVKSYMLGEEGHAHIGTLVSIITGVIFLFVNGFVYLLVSVFVLPGPKLNKIQEDILRKSEME